MCTVCIFPSLNRIGFCACPGFLKYYTASPLSTQTGLIWELAPKFGARIVFAEHRYEGLSLPPKNISKDCLGYSSTIQALADYARLLEEELNPNQIAPVIVFGGSYGGMLSAWMVSEMRISQAASRW